MKILVLMPCDEKVVYWAAEIYKNLDDNIKDNSFFVPMFMDYLIQTKQAENWVYALADGLISANLLCKKADEEKKDIIIFGNASSDIEFDEIFSFQDNELIAPYSDLFIEKTKTIFTDAKEFITVLENLHTKNDVKLMLTNCKATATLINDLIKSQVDLEKIKDNYAFLNFKDKEDFND
jgi:hypothetical protein